LLGSGLFYFWVGFVNKRLVVCEALVWGFLSFVFSGVAKYEKQFVLVDVFFWFMFAERPFFG
jgi:ABC-type transport system involved in multi-copper enzyme maturation permease subunit